MMHSTLRYAKICFLGRRGGDFINLILDKLPKAVYVEGKAYPVKTDFRDWIGFVLAMQDGALSPEEKAVRMLSLYQKGLPPTFPSAFDALLWFYRCGRESGKKEGRQREGKGAPLYHFGYDAQAIYAAFWGQYGIDLSKSKLHWWQFQALFANLDEGCQFVKIMQYRGMDLSTVKDKAQRAHYQRMKQRYALPDLRSEKEREADMMEHVSSLF